MGRVGMGWVGLMGETAQDEGKEGGWGGVSRVGSGGVEVK